MQAVKNIDLTVQPGEVVAFLGPNGAGKTTTIDMMLGLSDPTDGTVLIDGASPRATVDGGRIAAVTQTGGLLNDISVREHVALIARLFGYDAGRADQVLAQAGIADIAKRRTQLCSGGEKQRLKFAMALVCDPDLMILDEPTTGMDVVARRDFWKDIHEQAMNGRTVVFATHYLEEADEYANRIVMMVDGRIVADGTTAEVRNLANGRTVTADFANPADAQAATESIKAIASSVETQGAQAIVHTKDSDAVLKAWLGNTTAHDITVVSEGLEDAFLELAKDNQEDRK